MEFTKPPFPVDATGAGDATLGFLEQARGPAQALGAVLQRQGLYVEQTIRRLLDLTDRQVRIFSPATARVGGRGIDG